MTRVVVCLVLLVCAFSAGIAVASVDEPRIRIEQYTVNQGLVQNTITGIVEDADGFLWVATGAGLNRFDGHRFQRINGPDDAFSNRYISALHLADNGELWLAIPNSGIYSLAPGATEFSKRMDELVLDDWWFAEITRILTFDGNYYFIDEVALRQFDPDTGAITTLFEIEQLSETRWDLVLDALPFDQHILLATTQGVKAYHIESQAITPIPHLPQQRVADDANAPHYTQMHIKALYAYQDELYIGALAGLYRLNLDQLAAHLNNQQALPEATVLDGNLNVWQMREHQGDILLATHTGFYRYHRANSQVSSQLHFSQSDLPVFDNSIHHIHIDSDQNLWLGTWFNGLFHWRPSTQLFTNIAQGKPPFPHMSSNQVWSLAEDAAGRLWAGTQNGLNLLDMDRDLTLSADNPIFFTSEDDSAYIHDGVVYDIFPDANDSDTIWVYIADYVYRFTPSTGEAVALSQLATNSADAETLGEFFWGYNLIGDELWFADAEALYAFNTTTYALERFDTFDHAEFSPLNLYRIAGARPGYPEQLLLSLASEFWVFNRETGATERLYRHEPFNLYADQYMESIVEDHQGRLWTTLTGVGLVVFDANTLEYLFTLGQSDNLPSRYFYQGRVDAHGSLWFSSMDGLIHLDPDTLHARRFGYRDGVSSNEFNYTASAALSDGRLAYGSMRGLTLFNPLELHTEAPALQPRISTVSDVTTGSRLKVPFSNLDRATIGLAHDNRGLRIDVSTNSFDRPQEVRYHYQLEGPEQLSLTNMRDASLALPRLRPGQYRLQVTATNPYTGQLTDAAELSIRVGHAPLTSPFAMALYSIALSAFLLAFIYYRINQNQRLRVSKREAERSEERLQLAISATKSGIWDWHRDHDRLYETRVLSELGHTEVAADAMTLAHYRQYIHRRDLPQLIQQWQAMLRGDRDEINCTYRARDIEGNWIWFKDIGQVSSRDKDGLVERVTGVYQNITKARSTEEKARLFGQAFEQTQDWVLILDSDQLPMTANRAFCEAMGITERDLINFDFIRLNKARLNFYRDVLKEMQPGEQWRGEEIATLADGVQVPVLVNISAVADPHSAHRAFVIVFTDISVQKEAEARLRQLANYDPLTGLPNRTMLTQRLDEMLANPSEDSSQLAVLFMDLDRFKHINDTHGHNVGDSLLCVVAERLQRCVREHDMVARLGGDEFIILLSAPSEIAVESTAKRLLNAVNDPMFVAKHHLRVSPSIGIAYYPQHGKTRDELIKNADVAMYEAKAQGRNCAKVFRVEMDSKIRARLNLEVELKDAVNRHQLQNYYQPIVNAGRQHCVGVELLLRWELQDKLVSPDQFIPLAEDLGLIVTITESAMRRGLADLKRLRELAPELYLSINLSVRHLDHDTLPAYVAELLETFNLPPSALRFELTEGTLIEETRRAKQVMQQLRDLGIMLMLDDFGTGYSSLRYLKEFPIDVIKIDKGFTLDIGRDRSDEAIIETILAMASNLDKLCIAEGVETEAHQTWLLQRGCYLMQGYLYTPALKAGDIERWVADFERAHNTQ